MKTPPSKAAEANETSTEFLGIMSIITKTRPPTHQTPESHPTSFHIRVGS
jgi:hypothetical protein